MTLKYIFHLYDLHIRTCDKLSCRYDEYLLNIIIIIMYIININKKL